jgi:sec-independent protein translocase protein TatC
VRLALGLLASLLAASAGAAAQGQPLALWVDDDHVRVDVAGSLAQVRETLRFNGTARSASVHIPANAGGLQAFLLLGDAYRAAPWAWVAPGVLALDLGGGPNATSRALRDVELRYTLAASANGLALDLEPGAPTARLAVTMHAPEGWEARADGEVLATGEREWSGVAASERHELVLAPVAGASPVYVLAALTALLLVLTMARALTVRGKRSKAEMRLLDHLAELQGRLRSVVLVVAALMLFLFSFALARVQLGGLELAVPAPSLTDNIAAQTFRLLSQQFVPPGVQLVVVDPISAALVLVEVALFLAIVVASPLIGYQAGAFLMPALLPRERRLLLRAIPAATVLFLAGAGFAYLFMIPLMMRVLYSYAQGLGAVPFIAVDNLVSFAVIVTLVFGAAFELPVGMVALAKLGLASPRAMAKAWRHVVVGIFVVAAVITPDPSVVSQLLVALPLCGLYALGLVASHLASRTRARDDALSPASAPR